MNQLVQSNRPILVVADEVEGDALTNIVLKPVCVAHFHSCCGKAPGFGDREKRCLKI